MPLNPQDHEYDLNEGSIILGNIIIDSGFGAGTVLRIVPIEDIFTLSYGADGSATRSRKNIFGADISLFLMQSSPKNDELSALFQRDLDASNGAGVVPFTYRDRSGRTLFTAPSVWIKRWPDLEIGPEATEREWQLTAARMRSFHGGNTRLPAGQV